MRKSLITWYVITLFLCACFFYGCQSTTDSTEKEPSLVLDAEKIIIGEQTSSASFTIRNNGDGVLEWSIETAQNEEWLSIDTASGSGDRVVTVTVDKSILKAGTHTLSIDVSSNGGNKTIEIIVTVPETGVILIEGDIPSNEGDL